MTYSICKYSFPATWAPPVAHSVTGTRRSQIVNLAWKSCPGMRQVPVQKRKLPSQGRVNLYIINSLDIYQASERYGWNTTLERKDWKDDPQVQELPVKAIRRPLQGSRSNGKRTLFREWNVILSKFTFEIDCSVHPGS